MDTTIIAEIVTPLNRRLETASTQAKPTLRGLLISPRRRTLFV
ncbi:MAG: hypothetical protein WCO29_14650 [Nostocales cyanobacterium ELA583]|jgi:hypothetical protein